MIRKLTAALLCFLILLSLTACSSVDDAFQSAMDLITGDTDTKEESTETDPTDPDSDESVVKPAPQPPVNSAVWPDKVPAINKFNKKFDFTNEDEVFIAHYTLTVSQLQVWTAALTSAGFLGDPRIKDGLVVEFTETALNEVDADNGEKLVDIVIRIYNPFQTWPKEFSEFPKYEGKGTVSLYEIFEDREGSRILHYIIADAEKSSVEAYLKILLNSGFENRGEGVYAKEVGNKIYEFQGDPDKIWKDTTAELFWYIRTT